MNIFTRFININIIYIFIYIYIYKYIYMRGEGRERERERKRERERERERERNCSIYTDKLTLHYIQIYFYWRNVHVRFYRASRVSLQIQSNYEIKYKNEIYIYIYIYLYIYNYRISKCGINYTHVFNVIHYYIIYYNIERRIV